MSTVVEKVKLIMADCDNNNNKIWYGELRNDQSVLCEWGRVGKKLQSKLFPNAGENFLRKKEREKLNKGYVKLNVLEGSENVNGSGSSNGGNVSNDQLKSIAKKQIKHSNPIVAKLIDHLTQVNVHNIHQFSGGKITYNDTTGLFATPLGIITQENIDEAREVLSDIANLVSNEDYGQEMSKLSSRILMLVPKDIGMRRFDVKVEWSDISKIQQQNSVLDGLQASLVTATSTPSCKKTVKKADDPEVFNTELELVEDKKLIKDTFDNYLKNRSRQHGCYNLKPKQMWSVHISAMRNAYMKTVAKIGGEIGGYHGTGSENLLSLLKTGFLVRPPANAAISGKMFGNGSYFAPSHISGSSTKATNYSVGYWGGRSSSRTFLFLCAVAMGKHHTPRGTYSGPPKGYDSCWAKGNYKSGVLNDECIVYNDNQADIRFLIELTDR